MRAADALLRGVGGRTVMLRMPAPASAGDVTEQLGLAVPEFQDVELAPVIFRSARADGRRGQGREVGAAGLGHGGGDAGGVAGISARPRRMFAAAFGVLIDGVLMTVESATAAEADGAAYLYRLVLRAPLAQAV